MVAEVVPAKGDFVNHLELSPSTIQMKELFVRVESCVDILAIFFHVQRLCLQASSAFIVGLVPLFHSSFAMTVRHLQLSSDTMTHYIHGGATAALLHALPNLDAVDLPPVRGGDEGGPLVVNALCRLTKLRMLDISASHGIIHSTLGHPWASSLVSLWMTDISGAIFTIPILSGLLERHSSTLQALAMPYF